MLCNSNGEADADAEMQEGKDEGEEEMQEMKLCERLARFDKITVWGHEEIVDKVEDEIVKGVEEWVVLAAKVWLLSIYLSIYYVRRKRVRDGREEEEKVLTKMGRYMDMIWKKGKGRMKQMIQRRGGLSQCFFLYY